MFFNAFILCAHRKSIYVVCFTVILVFIIFIELRLKFSFLV